MDRAGSYGLSDGVSITSGSVSYARSVMDTHGTSNPAYAGSSPVGHVFKHEQQLFPIIKYDEQSLKVVLPILKLKGMCLVS